MKCKKIVEISAPNYGFVEDVNIYGVNAKIATKITDDLKRESFVHRTKAEIDGFELKHESDGLSLEIRVEDSEKCYKLGAVFVETTYGGLAYNTFQNLYTLNNALRDGLTLRPIIGLPSQLIQDLRINGMHYESKYFLPIEGRKSLMIVYECGQLNLVSKGKTPCGEIRQLQPPDIAIFSTYPEDMNAKEVDRVMQYRDKNSNLKVYFNPGSTQVMIGIQGFTRLMPLIALATMKLDEARKFLGINTNCGDSDKLATECIKRFLGAGVKICILNDSENGSYMGYNDRKYPYHVLPFPKRSIEKIVKMKRGNVVENFSGCGDGLFSAMLYASEVYPEMDLEDRLIFANSVARLISLLPESNLHSVHNDLIKDIFETSKSFSKIRQYYF